MTPSRCDGVDTSAVTRAELKLRPTPATRSLSDITLSTAANDLQPSALFSTRKNPQYIPANTPPVFPSLRPRSLPHILRLVTKGNAGQAPRHRLVP